MSTLKVRRALEIALDSITPSLSTAWENASFEPAKDTPYQQVHLLWGKPVNPAIGGSGSTILTRYVGFLQVSLLYPLQTGTLDISTRAELIKATFKIGASFINDAVAITVRNTPEITSGLRDGDRWRVAVIVPFYSNIFE